MTRRSGVQRVSLLTAVALAGMACAEPAPRDGLVQFSDGEILEGKISLSPGRDLQIHAGKELKELSIENLREIQFAPEKESMERKWRFVEAGRTEKEIYGKPYPVRYIRATAIVPGAGAVEGHLYTTVLYLENSDGARKIVLHAKLRGKPGETFGDLRYPVRVAFLDDAAGTEAGITVRAPDPAGSATRELVALTHGALIRLRGRKSGRPGEWTMASPLGAELFLAARADDGIVAAWHEERMAEPDPSVVQGLKDAKDFFDERDLLGIYADETTQNVYALLMLRRAGKTTMGGPRTQPWRLGIWRWKRGRDGRLLLAGRGYLLRGILAAGEAPPDVRLSKAMWDARVVQGDSVEIDPWNTKQSGK